MVMAPDATPITHRDHRRRLALTGQAPIVWLDCPLQIGGLLAASLFSDSTLVGL
jgi:hypothetical protein